MTDDRRLVAEPIMAWKRAKLVTDDQGRPAFKPLSATGTYGVDEVAECRPVPGITPIRSHHHVPDLADAFERLFSAVGMPPEYFPRVHADTVPDPGCACGYYATKDRTDPKVGYVTLRVALTGTVIVHERGYRAHRQQVVAVEIPKMCACYSTDVVGLLPAGDYRPVCRRCAPDPRILGLVSLSDLASSLCVDVSWCPPSACVDAHVSFGVTAAAFQTAMLKVGDLVKSSDQVWTHWQQDLSKALLPDSLWDAAVDEGPVHPLEAKRRRDEERRQRLEQLAGPRRAPRSINRPRSTR